MNTTVRITLDKAGFGQYRDACLGATKYGVQQAAQIVQSETRRLARQDRSAQHRIARRYRSGGKVYHEPKNLDMTVRRKSGVIKRGRRAGNPFGLVWFEYGYGVFRNYGTRKPSVRGRLYFQRALRAHIGRVMTALRQRWPK